ncbi:MAG: YlmH/Sll1252 family protein [Faecalimonas sp.]|nr:YlmH/Sll1252 family protein [Faecalimonas sp.]
MQKEEFMLQKRLIELSRTADQRGIVSFSDFLNLNELHILHTIPKAELYTPYCTFGGYDYAERQMVAFLSDALCYQYEYPISVLKIRPLQKKFAEELSHRDYLGAILNLGIERCKIGDILVMENEALVFVHSSLETFLKEELTRIRHTSVQIECIAVDALSYKPKTECIKGTVASLRLDSLLALAFSPSRSKIVPYIEGGKVFVNGKMITSNGYQIKEQDIVSVRGFGRFRYVEMLSETKKGRYLVRLEKYI